MVRTFVLIAPVQYVLMQLSGTYETIPNAPKFHKAHRNISLGSNGVDWVRSLQKISLGSNGVDQVHLLGKITTWLYGTNFYINCTSLVCFATSFMQLQNDPKCTEILQNGPKH